MITEQQRDVLEILFSEATVEQAEQLLTYASFMVRLKQKWADTPAPAKRKYTRKKSIASLVGAADSALALKEPGK